ncbi:SDR family NAD(P)-dependent oxidoreductase [Effusibacillus pohliae]|uniref:SDR family NAD(P)-dependent oxidoreductase n=1 Tax=Effusibacillus pohliae TaxID=232270 RepID=UPI00035DE259|nr:SDR family oxidoreductase [Effusibacillus pohliae]
MNLKGRVALITGASSGIGWETALAFAARGSLLAVAARSQHRLQELAAIIENNGGQCLPVPVDVTDPGSVYTMAQKVIDRYGRIDVLVNNAGFGVFAPVLEADMQDIVGMMDVNYFGVVRCIQAVVPHMVRQAKGCVVNVGSMAGFVAAPTHGGYAATKFAVIGLSEALREEVREHGVKVITINPGPIDTPFFERADIQKIPRVAQRFMQKPDRVARAIVRAVEQEIPQVMVPGGMAPLVKFKALMPTLFARGAGRLYRKQK